MSGLASAAIYSVLVPITKKTDLTVADLNAGTGYFVSFQLSISRQSFGVWWCLFSVFHIHERLAAFVLGYQSNSIVSRIDLVRGARPRMLTARQTEA